MLIHLIVALVAATAWADETYDAPNTWDNRQIMVHLFEWKWADIAKECESFLQYYGYGAVQVSPPMEHITKTVNNDMPWWIRYQPVSYKLSSRSGSRSEFINMVERCNAVGVRIIVDGVFNHMVGVGQKKNDGSGSSGDSDFDGRDGVESFPGVGYTSAHFNDWRCHGDIQGGDYQGSAEHVRNCRLVGLLDLDQGNSFVREKIVAYMNDLIDIGVAGFRLDASKHMWPGDLGALIGAAKNLRSDIYGDNKRPFIVHEVIDRGGEAVKCDEYISLGRYTDFNFGSTVAQAVWRSKDFSDMRYFGQGYGYGNLEGHDVLAFIDNHDNQRDGSPYVPIYKNGDQYAMAVGFMLGWNYGYPRVMSSYYFGYSDQGPPNYGSGSGFATKSPTFNSQYKTCDESSGWVCEHRWSAIRGMARFHQEVTGTAVGDLKYESNRLAFSRPGKGYFAVNNGDNNWSFSAQTSLPAGAYCDVWSGELQNSQCTGVTVNVNSGGTATFNVPKGQFMAIHTGWKI